MLLLCTKIGKSINYFIMQWKMTFVKIKVPHGGNFDGCLRPRLRLQLLFNYSYVSSQTIVLNALIMICKLQFL
jgi:hypothetical protein